MKMQCGVKLKTELQLSAVIVLSFDSNSGESLGMTHDCKREKYKSNSSGKGNAETHFHGREEETKWGYNEIKETESSGKGKKP